MDEMSAPGDVFSDLAAIGYDTGLPAGAVITAFQRHFLPGHLTGEADAETAGRAAGLRKALKF
jgi:N-acetylmuramoyl-L-alanine amidase